MLMVKADALLIDGGRYFWGGRPYSGIAFTACADGRVLPQDVVDGEIKGPHDFSLLRLSSPGIDISGFTEDDVDGYDVSKAGSEFGFSYLYSRGRRNLRVSGVPYSGAAYAFLGAFCVQALLYSNGFAEVNAKWDRSGLMRELVVENDIDQYYSWYENGALKSAQLSVTVSSSDKGAFVERRILLTFSSDGELCFASLEGDFASVAEMVSKAEFFPLRDVRDVRQYELSNSFEFSGNEEDRVILFGK